uniref:Uncharacterized protein n=1 Tax=Onchocerca volvulus TaxID=6282 RepID=A0A8R1TN64_ONCVO
MYNQENHDKRRNDERFILSLPFGTSVENKSYFKPIKLFHPYSDKDLEVPQSNYDQPSESLNIDDSDLIDDSTSAAQLSTSSPISVTSASTSSFYPTNLIS